MDSTRLVASILGALLAVPLSSAAPAAAATSAPIHSTARVSMDAALRPARLGPGQLRLYAVQPVVLMRPGATAVRFAAVVACRPFVGLPHTALFLAVQQGNPATQRFEDIAFYANDSRDPVRCDGRPQLVRSELHKELLEQPTLRGGRAVAHVSLVGSSADGHFLKAGEQSQSPIRVLVLPSAG
jgi:hypothetical protein